MKSWSLSLLGLLLTACGGGDSATGAGGTTAASGTATATATTTATTGSGSDASSSSSTGGAYAVATLHGIDVDPGDGPFASGSAAQVSGVVVISPADKYLSLSTSQCRYQAWVQDPQCTTVPCGLVVKSYGATVPGIMSAAECPSPAASGTLAGSLSQGAFLDVTGKVLVALDSTAPSTVIEHAILLDSVNLRPNAPTIQPTVLSDSTALASLASHTGSGWNQYEGMLVTLVPSTGPLTVTMASTGGFRTTPGNSDWGDTFESNYTPGAILFYPTDGLTFQSITGVVSARHGGNLLARNDPDFVP